MIAWLLAAVRVEVSMIDVMKGRKEKEEGSNRMIERLGMVLLDEQPSNVCAGKLEPPNPVGKPRV